MAELVHAYNDNIMDKVMLPVLLETLHDTIPAPFKTESTSDCNAAAWLDIFTRLGMIKGAFSDDRFEMIVASAKKKFGSFKDTPELVESAILAAKSYDHNIDNLLSGALTIIEDFLEDFLEDIRA